MSAEDDDREEGLDVSTVEGNVPDEIKAHILMWKIGANGDGFANDIIQRITIKSLYLNEKTASGKQEAVATTETVVQEDMVNSLQTLHGGCVALLFDYCTSMAIPVLRREEEWMGSGVTLSLNVSYFQPALVGDKITIISRTLSSGRRSSTVSGEIWHEKRGLLASAVHTKMVPQGPRL